MNPQLIEAMELQLAQAICAGKREVTMDDATDDGRLSNDPSHEANRRQNALGSFLPRLADRGILVRTDRFAQARSKHRRGGSLKVWKVTKVGERWALELANIQRAAAVKRYTAQVEAEPWPSILRANYQVVNGDHRRAATRRIRRRIETVLDDEG